MALLTSYWTLDGILIFMPFILTAYLFMIRNFRYWAKRGVIEIPPVPFVGNALDVMLFRMPPSVMLRRLYEATKGLPYMGFYILDRPFLLLRDVELVKQVLVKDFNVFPDRFSSPDVADRLGYSNLFMKKNPAWRVFRSKMSSLYTTGNMKNMVEYMREIGDDLDRHLESLNLGGTGSVVEVKNLSASYTTDLISFLSYGVRANSLKDSNSPFRKCSSQIFAINFIRAYELLLVLCDWRLVKVTGAKFFGQAPSRFMQRAFTDVLRNRLESGEKRDDLIDLLVQLRNQQDKEGTLNGFEITDNDLISQAAIFLLAGFETSSTTMAFTLYELAMNPDVQNTLRKEIHEAFEQSGGEVTYDMLMSLPYLHKVVSETLRMYPPLGFLERVAIADYKMPNSDLVVEKGTPIYVPMMGLHNDPEFFPNPEKYDPERFSEENKQKRPHYSYIPFGGGPRGCIGVRLGLMQSKLGVLHVIRNYEVTPCEKTPIPMVLDPRGVATTSSGGIHLNVRKLTTKDS